MVGMLAEMKLALLGRHQLDNAAAAIAAADVLREQGWQSITQDTLLQGLQQTALPGRLQVSPTCFAVLRILLTWLLMVHLVSQRTFKAGRMLCCVALVRFCSLSSAAQLMMLLTGWCSIHHLSQAQPCQIAS